MNSLLSPFNDEPINSDQKELLQSIPLFKNLSLEQLAEISELLYERDYRTGEIVHSAGDPATALYIIVSGEVEIIVEDDSGQENELACLDEGEFFGERALSKNLERTATAKIHDDAVLLVLFRQELLELFQRDKDLAVVVLSNLVEVLGDRLQSANYTIQELMNQQNQTEESEGD